ncbi:MAG: DUF1844 domain-containing protein [Planctomycetaceae bacterium]
MTDEMQPTSSEGADEAEARRRDLENLPPPRFETLIQILSTQAVVALGMVPGPNGEVTREMPLARHFIDLLAILEEKTKGNRTPEENRNIDTALHELRIAFTHTSNQLKK